MPQSTFLCHTLDISPSLPLCNAALMHLVSFRFFEEHIVRFVMRIYFPVQLHFKLVTAR